MASRAGSCTRRSSVDISSNGGDTGSRLQGALEQEMIAKTNDDEAEGDELIEEDIANGQRHAEGSEGGKDDRGGGDEEIVEPHLTASRADIGERQAYRQDRQEQRWIKLQL